MARLLQVFNQYRERGGEEKSVQRIFRHVSELGPIKKCWFDSSAWDGPLAPGKLKQATLIGNNPAARRRLREASNASGADAWLVHNVVPVASFGVYREAAELGIPVIQYCHNFRPFSVSGTLWANGKICDAGLSRQFGPEVRAATWQKSRVKSAILAQHLKSLHRSGALDNVKMWIGISEFVAQKFRKAGVPAERVVALRHSWDARPAAPEWRDEGHYLFLSRLVEEKGVRTLLDSWALLQDRLGGNCPRLVIGGTGPLEAEVRAAAQGSHAIEYLDFVAGGKKQDLIDGCRAMLCPSIWWEPLGLVTYEAYDSGKPMLAAASGGLIETVRQGETGLLHEPGNAASLAETVLDLEERGASGRRKMGANGRKWLLREANADLWKQRFANILRKCLA